MIGILYRDRDIAVVVKPVGALSERDGNKISVPLLIEEATGEKDIRSVHRLDKNVGGVMVYALNAKAASELTGEVKNGGVVKEYLAVVKGVPDPEAGEMTDLLYHDPAKNKTYVVKRERRGVRDAKLAYQTLEGKNGLSLVRVRLYTGRTHQIRVQFASRCLPLVGDGRYGDRGGGDKPMLFSFRLTFSHPITGKRLTFTALPDFSDAGFGKDTIAGISETAASEGGEKVNTK